MWGSTFSTSSSVEGMIEAERRSYDGLAEVIASGQQDGSIRTDVDPTASAVLLLGMMRGIAALLLTDSAITDMRRVRRTSADWISSSLAADAGARDDERQQAAPSLDLLPGAKTTNRRNRKA